MGDIGKPIRHIELEPMPEFAPIEEPSPQFVPEEVPVFVPEEEPVPA